MDDLIQDEDLYVRLESLSKSLEGSGVICEENNPDAYATVLDTMNFVRKAANELERLSARVAELEGRPTMTANYGAPLFECPTVGEGLYKWGIRNTWFIS